MKINEAMWNQVKKRIEEQIQKDSNITDVIIKCRVKESALRNYLQINLTI
jgi:hypothetical protein|tara:strand:- start:273 stop:422 length:150 start_codon:yes stop_codon:yes gene_type:complete